MNHPRTLTLVCSLLATAFLAFAQSPTPRAAAAPPAPPADVWDQTPMPAPAPRPATAPMAPMAPLPPMPPVKSMPAMAPMPPMDVFVDDLDVQVNLNQDLKFQLDMVKEQAERMKFDYQDRVFANSEAMQAANEMARAAQSDKFNFAFAPQATGMGGMRPPTPPMPPKAISLRGMSEDHAYEAGQRALDSRQWDQAVGFFGQVVGPNSSRADGALYWKAYALGRLGRREDAGRAIADLRNSFATSRWLDDAKALELELKQASGQSVSPEAESDEELKLMAINGLMQSDPERAIPLLEGLLKGSASPKVKRNTLFVLAQSNSPKAQALVQQIARGGANPDLQLKAVSYMNERRSPNNPQILAEIYASTSDVAVKRAILQSYAGMRDKDRLLQVAKTEKTPELREAAINYLAGNNGNPELWQLYQTETTPEGKRQLLRYMFSNGNSEKLLEVVRNEKDPQVRTAAVRALVSQKTGITAETMVTLYNSEQDTQIKQSILDGLYSQRNAKALVDIARAEKDTRLKLRIVERLSNMKSKEASDYLEELLKK